MISNFFKKIRIASFRYKKHPSTPNDDRKYFGVMAQDLAEFFDPKEYSIVTMERDGYYCVDYIQLVPLLIKQVQDLEKRIEELENARN